MSDDGPKITIAPFGIDVSWKVWSLVVGALLTVFIVCLAFFAIAAGVNVKVIDRDWSWFRGKPVEAEADEDDRPRIFRDESEVES